MDSRIRLDRIGEVNLNKYGNEMKIIEYVNNTNIVVEFKDGYKNQVWYSQFLEGYVSNPYDRSCYDIGFLDEGEYKTKLNNKFTPHYRRWSNMMSRCYNVKTHIKQPSYIGCSVAPEWHSFQVFAKWYDDNYYWIDGNKMCLDKDILLKGNKIYSPENCVFVPERINILFVKHDEYRGNLPIGVVLHKRTVKMNNYKAMVSDINNEPLYLGVFDTINEAFLNYKIHKENVIKEVANKYKDTIPMKLYKAMYEYSVEITD